MAPRAMFERFTEKAIKVGNAAGGHSREGDSLRRSADLGPERLSTALPQVVMLAQEEARRLGHNFVGTEQLLLGLIGESTGAPMRRFSQRALVSPRHAIMQPTPCRHRRQGAQEHGRQPEGRTRRG